MAKGGKTITQRIALEGDKEIRAGLKALGEEGQKAFQSIKSAADATGEIGSDLSGRLKEIRDQTRNVGDSFRELKADVIDLGKNLTLVVGSITAVAGALFTLSNSATKAADEARDTAASFGLTIREYGRLDYALKQSGSSAGESQAAFASLNEQIKKTRDEGAGANTVFNRLGISVRGAGEDGLRPTSEILGDLAEKFRAMPEGIEKSTLAAELFGKRAGPRLVPLLNEGRAGLVRLGDEAERLGIVFTKAEGEVGDNFQDALNKLMGSVAGLKNAIGLAFAPLFTEIFDGVADAIAGVRPAFVEFSKFLVESVAPTVREVLAAILGNDDQVKSSWIIAATVALKLLGATVLGVMNGIIIPTLNGLLAVIQLVLDGFNGIFGTNFTAQQIVVAAGLVRLIGLFGTLMSTVRLLVVTVTALVTIFGFVPVAIAAITVALVVFLATNTNIVNGIRDAWSNLWTGIQQQADGFISGLVAAIQALPVALQTAFVTIGEFIATLFTDLLTAAQSVAEGFIDAFQFAVDSILGFFQSMFESVMKILNQIAAAAKKVKSAVSGGGASAEGMKGGGIVQAAGGGHIRGPGTGTSDSILAWLSDGEYVMPEKAVRHFGVNFFNSLRKLRDPFKDMISGFSGGGFVDALAMPLPRFAGGGLATASAASSGRPLTLNLDGQSFGPFSGSEQAVDQLQRYAMKRNVRRSGRKPTWYGS